MNRITLIQCTNSKRDEQCLAEHLYDESAYYRKMRAWAQSRENPWFILSAKYGLLNPIREVSPYDDVGISKQQAAEIAQEIDEMGVSVADITAGRKYTNELVPALERRGINVVEHFAGLSIGKRMKSLDTAREDS